MFVLATLVVPAVITQVRYNEIYSPAAQERSVAYLLVTSNRAARELQSGDLVDLVSSIAEWARNGAHDATGADLCIKQRISANADEYMIEAIYNGDEETSVMASITQLAQVGCEPETP